MESTDSSSQSKPLHRMFTAVPPRYDLINHVITLGRDKRWRRLATMACLETRPRRVLDLGCGTGDLAINLALLAEKGTEITGLDFSLPMLERAKEKAARAGEKVKFVHGEAEHLPFPDGYFDCVGISFAFRNLTYKNPAGLPHFSEVLRVLKPGGRYVIVESSQPQNSVIRALFHFYLRIFVAPVGTLLSSNKGAYRYLAESAAHFYKPEEIKEMLLAAGFGNVIYRPLLWGAAGIHVATRVS
jgi:demethylmenaquinone methyltransferase/2-methoxy-6-polyprenyl-1,4-benzoquinol methylase